MQFPTLSLVVSVPTLLAVAASCPALAAVAVPAPKQAAATAAPPLPMATLGTTPSPPATAVVARRPPDPRWPFVAPVAKAAAPAGGVGLVLEVKGDTVVVAQAVAGGPAARAGLQAGDAFVSVDGWPVPAGAKVPDVAGHIRGKPGVRCHIEVRRAGQVVAFELERAAMDRLFPPTSAAVIAVGEGQAVLATGTRHTIGVRFADTARPGELLRYRWATAPGEVALSVPAVAAPPGAPGQAPPGQAPPGYMSGDGAVLVDATAGAVIQVADLRLELKSAPATPEAGGAIAPPDAALQVFVATANLPLHVPAATADATAWLKLAPPFPTLVKPRSSPPKHTARWKGAARLGFTATLAGKPLAVRRLTLRMADAGGTTLDTATATTDAAGRVEFLVPEGAFTVQSLQASVAGAGRDAFFEAQLPSPQQVAAGPLPAGSVLPLLALEPRPVAQAAEPLPWGQDARVGAGLPRLEVARWLGQTPGQEPKTLQGQVLLLYVWATWCGPCKATAPMVAELHARLASRGLKVVAASIDRDEAALDAYAAERLPGAPPIAWIGAEAMEPLDFDSVPTVVVVDGKGAIRGLAHGSGWSVDAAEAWLTPILAEGNPGAKAAAVPARR